MGAFTAMSAAPAAQMPRTEKSPTQTDLFITTPDHTKITVGNSAYSEKRSLVESGFRRGFPQRVWEYGNIFATRKPRIWEPGELPNID